MTNAPRANIDPSIAFWNTYLAQNVEASRTLKRMHFIIEKFRMQAARLIVSKCIDGRVHGSKGKGYPPTTVVFSRSEGNNIDTDSSNFFFWRRIDEVVIDAARNTPGKPALFIALGHFARKGHGCAAHGEDNDRALAVVKEQAERVRGFYDPKQLYTLYGMTNTDDGTETLYFPDGTRVSSDDIIQELGLTEPKNVFLSDFLAKKIPDGDTDKYIGGKTPADIVTGKSAGMYSDLQTALAMEQYLIQEISTVLEKRAKNTVIETRLFTKVRALLSSVRGLPQALKGALAYQIIWNVGHGLYQRNRVEAMAPDAGKEHFEHSETVVAYGEGYEAKNRNSIILVKPGRGDDREALRTARKVLEGNRAHSKKLSGLPPLVHINTELVSAIDSWQALNAKILSDIRSRTRIVREVFGADVHVLTTYSYRSQKLFYPVYVDEPAEKGATRDDARNGYDEVDLVAGLNESNFSPTNFKDAEEVYILGGV